MMQTQTTPTWKTELDAILAERGACPACGGVFRVGRDVVCAGCGVVYADAGERRDLRLRAPRRVQLDVEIGGAAEIPSETNLGPLPLKADGIDVGDSLPRHLSRELVSHIPRAARGAVALDLGCGSGLHRGVLERAGYRYVGVDYGADGAPALADGHALPFRDGAIDFVLSIAVLEHIRHPLVMMKEVARVLRPGGMFVGTVAFLEPFHSNSYFHHTHLGTWSVLDAAGFVVDHVSPSAEWQALRAQAKNGLFPGLPRKLAVSLVAPLDRLHGALWRAASRRHASLTEEHRLRKHAGAFRFVARKPDA